MEQFQGRHPHKALRTGSAQNRLLNTKGVAKLPERARNTEQELMSLRGTWERKSRASERVERVSPHPIWDLAGGKCSVNVDGFDKDPGRKTEKEHLMY